MPNPLSVYLRRFRRLVAPPGRPAPGAVPVDRVAASEAEVEALLEVIDRIGREAQAITGQAEETAARQRDETRGRIERVRSEARHRADRARESAAALQQEQVSGDVEAIIAEARERVGHVTTVAQERLPRFTERVVRELLGADVIEAGVR